MNFLAATKKCLISVIIQLSQNTMMISNKLVIAKMKDKSGVVAVDEFVGLMLKMYSFLAHKNEHKKASQPTIQCRICVASTFIRLSTDFENETKTDVGFSTLYNISVRC